MKTTVRLLLTALGLAAASTAHAQLPPGLPGDTYTPNFADDTISAVSLGNTSTPRAFTQTMTFPTIPFSNSLQYKLSAIDWLVTSANGNSAVAAGGTLDFYFSEWNTGTNKPTGSALYTTSNSLTAYTGAKFITLSPSVILDPTKTYAMTMVARGVNTNFRFAVDLAGDPLINDIPDETNYFFFGRSFSSSAAGANYSALTSASFSGNGQDYIFKNLALTPIPETGTVAVAFAGVLVAGLAVRRRRAAKTVATVA